MDAGYSGIMCQSIRESFIAGDAEEMENATTEWEEVGGYDQKIMHIGLDIKDVSCTCRWMTIHPYAWKEGRTICKHLKSAIKYFREKKKMEEIECICGNHEVHTPECKRHRHRIQQVTSQRNRRHEKRKKKMCIVPGCEEKGEREIVYHQYCKKHRERFKKHDTQN